MYPLDSIVREALIDIAVMCFPILGTAALCGMLVALLQAATQVQEQTLTLLPKVVAVGLLIALLGRWGIGLCAALLEDAVRAIPSIVLSV